MQCPVFYSVEVTWSDKCLPVQLVGTYADQGLAAICFPTDQGDYEPDDSTTVRIKVQQQFGMASSIKGPIAVTDKTDRDAPTLPPVLEALPAASNLPWGSPRLLAPITINGTHHHQIFLQLYSDAPSPSMRLSGWQVLASLH